MKSISTGLLLTLAAAAQAAATPIVDLAPRADLAPQTLDLETRADLAPRAGKVKMEVRYSDVMVEVGNLDIFAETWQKIYAESGNRQAILTEHHIGAQTDTCTHKTDFKMDVNVVVKMDGAWGETPTIHHNLMREAIVHSGWEILKRVSDRFAYTVYNGCLGTTWQEGVTYTTTAACGPKAATKCGPQCQHAGTPDLVQCEHKTIAHKVPKTIKVHTFIDGRLLPDQLTIEFTSQAHEQGGGCGFIGSLTTAVAGYIPVVGNLFSAGIDLACDH